VLNGLPRIHFVIVLILCSSAMPQGAAAETARGFVFDDTDGDGVKDSGENGIAGVTVSNGIDVVRTAPDGSYAIDVQPDSILFITKPAGYDLPLDENNLVAAIRRCIGS